MCGGLRLPAALSPPRCADAAARHPRRPSAQQPGLYLLKGMLIRTLPQSQSTAVPIVSRLSSYSSPTFPCPSPALPHSPHPHARFAATVRCLPRLTVSPTTSTTPATPSHRARSGQTWGEGGCGWCHLPCYVRPHVHPASSGACCPRSARVCSAQVSFSGCLIENINSLAAANHDGYAPGWNAKYAATRLQTTTGGFPKLDLVRRDHPPACAVCARPAGEDTGGCMADR